MLTVAATADRYTEWVRFDNTSGVANWTHVVGRELYPEASGGATCRFDTDGANVVADPANAAVVSQLSGTLRGIISGQGSARPSPR